MAEAPGAGSAWKTDMGITIVQKSDLTVRKRNPRVALVLAGGAISGGGFKLGGLKAFDDFLVNRKTTDFDMYVGLSAGAFLGAPLASGVTPPVMMRSLEGSSTEFTQFGLLDFYQPNYHEFLEKPLRYVLDLAAFIPGSVLDLVAKVSIHRDAALSARYPAGIPNRLTVTLDDGRRLVKEVDHPRGHARNPMTDAEVEYKFRSMAEPLLAESKIIEILDRCWSLDEQTNIGELLRLESEAAMAARVRPPSSGS